MGTIQVLEPGHNQLADFASVALSYVAGVALYAIFTGQNGYVYYKQVYNG